LKRINKLVLFRDDMAKIQKWAMSRHLRGKTEDNRGQENNIFSGGLLDHQSSHHIAEAIVSLVKDWKENGPRNEQIGALMLIARAGSWDFFMELNKKWEKMGGCLSVTNNCILMNHKVDSKLTIAALEPGADNGAGLISLRWSGWEEPAPSQPKIDNYQIDVNLIAPGEIIGNFKVIHVTDPLGLVDTREYLRALSNLCSL